MDNKQITLPIIGIVISPLKQKFGAPRQPNLVDVNSTIQILPPYDDVSAFNGIEQFSHLWIIWQFHQNRVNDTNKQFRPTVRPPRLGGNQKIGVFASRSMYRPANIGLSVVKLSHVENNEDGIYIHIVGGDMVDGTPIIDIKPYLAYSDNILDAVSGYADQTPSVKVIEWHSHALERKMDLIKTNSLSNDDFKIIEALIAQDPRPAYRQNEIHTIFVMRYQDIDIQFCQISENILQIRDMISLS